MMNFTPKNAELVVTGFKSQTRRKPHHGELVKLAGIDIDIIGGRYRIIRHNGEIERVEEMINLKWRKLWAVGDVIAVCPGRGKKGIGHVRITAIRREQLQAISVDDAVAEGIEWRGVFRNEIVDAFRDLWNSIYHGQRGKQWEDNPYVFALTFELVQSEKG